jgi:Domain of unknown function (DUF4411)
MPTDKKYLLDANVFIEAKRRYYAFDVCPGFWECLVWHHGQISVQSIDRVKQELELGDDDLKQWVDSVMPSTCFASSDAAEVISEYAQMQIWVQQQPQFSQDAKAEFAAKADAWLIAYAKVNNLVLVTHEAPAPASRRRVPIPSVCEAFDVPYVDTFAMLRDLEAQFNWRQPNT